MFKVKWGTRQLTAFHEGPWFMA